MTKPAPVRQRNLTLECCRMVAAIFVVFLHVPFPGQFGGLMACLSRFAVPMFFAISGYYSFRTEPGKLLRRAVRIWSLELAGIGLQLAWKCVQGRSEGVSVFATLLERVPDGSELTQWLVFQVDPFAGHLWYLSAAAVCHLMLAVYARLRKQPDYRPLYVLSFLLLSGHFAMSEFSGFTGIRVDYTVYRNAWFFGIPMFIMGLFLRQLREGFAEDKKQAVSLPLAVLLTGVALSVAEWRVFGGRDLHVGTVAAVAGLMLLTAARPHVPRWLEKAAGSFGFLSTAVYLVHLIVYDVYNYHYSWRLNLSGWLVPLLVAAVSVLIVAAAWLVRSGWRRIRK